MKQLMIGFLMLCSLIGSAQIMETDQPDSIVEIDNTIYKIDGVSGLAGNIVLYPTDSVNFTIYLQFHKKQDSSWVEIPRSAMNADWYDFVKGVKAAAPPGTPDNIIYAQVQQLMRGMIAGNKQEKLQAYNAIMTGYGAPLKMTGYD